MLEQPQCRKVIKVAKKKEIIEETTEAVVVDKFTKQQFLESKTYRQYRDFLSVVLDDKQTYSKEEVNKIINIERW